MDALLLIRFFSSDFFSFLIFVSLRVYMVRPVGQTFFARRESQRVLIDGQKFLIEIDAAEASKKSYHPCT